MSIVNMCNYSEDIKDIFLMKNGSQIIYDLLDSKDEDILLNNLRLIMTLITQKKQETSQIGRMLSEEGKCRIIVRLIRLIKYGPEIFFCKFGKETYLMAISLLRAFMLYSPVTKRLIMTDRQISEKNDPRMHKRYPNYVVQPIVECLISMLDPKKIDNVN